MAKTNRQEAERLAKLSSDCSFLLSHLVRQRQDGKLIKSDKQAQEILLSILAMNSKQVQPILKGGLIDWYATLENHKVLNPSSSPHFYEPEEILGVCFTDCTLSGLRAHRDIFGVKYGIAFDREYLYKRGANPCINIREDILKLNLTNNFEQYNKLHNFLPEEIVGYINIINETFDATHEREWRFLGDLIFSYQDIKFIFCPENEFHLFSHVQEKGKPVLFDLQWLTQL